MSAHAPAPAEAPASTPVLSMVVEADTEEALRAVEDEYAWTWEAVEACLVPQITPEMNAAFVLSGRILVASGQTERLEYSYLHEGIDPACVERALVGVDVPPSVDGFEVTMMLGWRGVEDAAEPGSAVAE